MFPPSGDSVEDFPPVYVSRKRKKGGGNREGKKGKRERRFRGELHHHHPEVSEEIPFFYA